MDTSGRDEIKRELLADQRLERVEGAAKEALARGEEALRKSGEAAQHSEIREVRLEIEGKLEKIAHGLTDQWEEKLGLALKNNNRELLVEIKKFIAEEIADDLPKQVNKIVDDKESEKRQRQRGSVRFWFYVITSLLAIASAVFTGLFWLTQI